MVNSSMARQCEASRSAGSPYSSASRFPAAVPGRERRLLLNHPGPDAELAETGAAGRQDGARHCRADGSICSGRRRP
jgi:hypothetical protein